MKVSVSDLDSSKLIAVHSALSKSHAQGKSGADLSFGNTAKASRELAKAITPEMPWVPKSLEWLKQHNGEILNAVVTAVGTAFVAPIFIAFNPFSKEDKETKAYSAWRQPISAVLALATQYGIMVPYNKHLDKLASTGKFDRANLSMQPTEAYLKGVIKADNPGRKYTKEEMSKAIKKKQNNIRWAAINKAREQFADRVLRVEEYVDDEARDAARKEIEAEFKSQLETMKEKPREKFIEGKLTERAKIVAERQVAEGTAVKSKAAELARNAQSENKTFAQLIEGVQAQFEAAEGTEKTFLKKVLGKLKGYQDYKNMKYLNSTTEQIAQSVKIKKMIFAQIQEAEKVLDGYKRYTGIVVTLITLPFSCGLLNWVYPRLMEIIMPRKKSKQALTKPADNFEKTAAAQRKEGVK